MHIHYLAGVNKQILIQYVWAGDFPVGSVVKESACNAGDAGGTGLIPELGRSPGGQNGNLLQYACLQNPTDRGSIVSDRQSIVSQRVGHY